MPFTKEQLLFALGEGMGSILRDAQANLASETVAGNLVKIAEARGEVTGTRMCLDLVRMLADMENPPEAKPLTDEHCQALAAFIDFQVRQQDFVALVREGTAGFHCLSNIQDKAKVPLILASAFNAMYEKFIGSPLPTEPPQPPAPEPPAPQ